jgi:hypothetical protein
MRNPPKAYWALFERIQERINPVLKRGIRPGLLNPLFGLPQPETVPKGPEPSSNERYWLTWFEEFMEIDSSMNRSDQALAYLSHYPGNKALRFHGLTEASWLRYHIEAYLQETYILFKRFDRFLSKVEKVAIDARDKSGVSSAEKLKTGLRATLKSVVATRSRHVHEYRFQDDELKNLDTLILLTNAGKMRSLRGFRRVQYLTALLKWRKQLRTNNEETQKLCTVLLEEVKEILTRNEPRYDNPRPEEGVFSRH